MKVKCPVCEKAEKWEGNPYRPFCSRRCQLVDLDGWLCERYRIPLEESSETSLTEGKGLPEKADAKDS